MKRSISTLLPLLLLPAISAVGAYHHGGDTDSDIVLGVYPAIEGTKLDSCALCHTGGEYEKKPGVMVSLGSCQWCHFSYGYDGSGDIDETLNDYGLAYQAMGKSAEALKAIEDQDADLDGYTNLEEITALRFPGNGEDDPAKVAAPFKVISLEELEGLPYHSQLMLMNTHKSGDFYAEYGGIAMEDLLEYSDMLRSATGITVYAPDGWAQYHPLEEDSDPLMYHVFGEYLEAPYYYDTQADTAITLDIGWCDYSSPALVGLPPNEMIVNDRGLKMLLAYTRDGDYLQPGELTASNKLDGEGPFRVVPPQKLVGPPDQSVNSDAQDVVWPFDEAADHNAGFATRSATIIKVEPLPEGTTDIDTMEAGWNYVDEGKILIYGALDPSAVIMEKLAETGEMVRALGKDLFKNRMAQLNIDRKIEAARRTFADGRKSVAIKQLNQLALRLDGCPVSGEPDRNDWITECRSQLPVYWAIHEIQVLMAIPAE